MHITNFQDKKSTWSEIGSSFWIGFLRQGNNLTYWSEEPQQSMLDSFNLVLTLGSPQYVGNYINKMTSFPTFWAKLGLIKMFANHLFHRLFYRLFALTQGCQMERASYGHKYLNAVSQNLRKSKEKQDHVQWPLTFILLLSLDYNLLL